MRTYDTGRAVASYIGISKETLVTYYWKYRCCCSAYGTRGISFLHGTSRHPIDNEYSVLYSHGEGMQQGES